MMEGKTRPSATKKRIEEYRATAPELTNEMLVEAIRIKYNDFFIDNEEDILNGNFNGSLIKHISQPLKEAYDKCSNVAINKIYKSRDVVDIELAGFHVISTLLELMIDAVQSPEKAYSQLLINRVSSQYDINSPTLYGKIQAVLDYISGMTDVYALDLYRKIKGNGLPAV